MFSRKTLERMIPSEIIGSAYPSPDGPGTSFDEEYRGQHWEMHEKDGIVFGYSRKKPARPSYIGAVYLADRSSELPNGVLSKLASPLKIGETSDGLEEKLREMGIKYKVKSLPFGQEFHIVRSMEKIMIIVTTGYESHARSVRVGRQVIVRIDVFF